MSVSADAKFSPVFSARSAMRASDFFVPRRQAKPYLTWMEDECLRMARIVQSGNIVAKLRPDQVKPIDLDDRRYRATYDRDIAVREHQYRTIGSEALSRGDLMALDMAAGMATGFGGTAKGSVSAISDARFTERGERLSYLDIKRGNYFNLQTDNRSHLLAPAMVSTDTYRSIVKTLRGFAEKLGIDLVLINPGAPRDEIERIRDEYSDRWDSSIIVPIVEQPTTLYVSSDGMDLGGEYMKGHGDFYSVVKSQLSDVIDVFGIKHIFTGNIDNVGATVSRSIYGYFISEQLEAMMETAEKFEGDKGGVAALIDDNFSVLEEPMVPEELRDAFLGRELWPDFNTNTMWFLASAITQRDIGSALPLMLSKRFSEGGSEWLKLETIIGHGLGQLRSRSLVIDRGLRFNPAKFLTDLWLGRTDYFRLLHGRTVIPVMVDGKYVTKPSVTISKSILGEVADLDGEELEGGLTRPGKIYNHGANDSMVNCDTLIMGGVGKTPRGESYFDRTGDYQTDCAVSYEGNVAIIFEHHDAKSPGRVIINGRNINDTIRLRDCIIYVPAGHTVIINSSVIDMIYNDPDNRVTQPMLQEFYGNATRWPQAHRDEVAQFFSRMIPVLPPMKTSAAQRMITLADFNDPAYQARLTESSRNNLRAADAICEVVGSLVREYEIEDGTVYVQALDKTMQGLAVQYPTQAPSRVAASEMKSNLARQADRIAIESRFEYDVMHLPNPQSTRGGEIVTLFLRFKDDVSEGEIEDLFGQKIADVIIGVRATQKPGSQENHSSESVRQFILSLPAREIFMSSVDTLVQKYICDCRIKDQTEH